MLRGFGWIQGKSCGRRRGTGLDITTARPFARSKQGSRGVCGSCALQTHARAGGALPGKRERRLAEGPQGHRGERKDLVRLEGQGQLQLGASSA